jgi:cell wall-associated NlpC family hydrolase
VKNVFAKYGVSLPRHSGDQAKVGRAVDGADLRPGDRLYFDMKRVGRISHTGIYIGNGYFIHASSNRRGVGVDSIFKSNYYRALVNARRDF